MLSLIGDTPANLYNRILDFGNLHTAWRKAARGKRSGRMVARFEDGLADHLLDIQAELTQGDWKPAGYVQFEIAEPKRRLISAAPFRDRVVHHALCNVIEPLFEARFIPDSYANRIGKGTHRAVARCQEMARAHRHVLRLDIVKHFPAIDHDASVRGWIAHVRYADSWGLRRQVLDRFVW
jgi:RNA-directed DNA polymerase